MVAVAQTFKVQVVGILVGSKESGEEVKVTEEAFAKALSTDLVMALEKKVFKSGNKGFYAGAMQVTVK